MSKRIIYLDYAATTPVTQEVAETVSNALYSNEFYANTESQHLLGKSAKQAINVARKQIAATINAESEEIIFTSGATESINLALTGAAALNRTKGNHIITLATEHAAVLNTCLHLEKHGYIITRLNPNKNGLLDLQELQTALRPTTSLVSIAHINNETGIIQNIEQIARITAKNKILLHIDAAQSIGKIALDVKKIPINLMSLSSHKCNGPKGIGALFLRQKPRVRVSALFHGGGQENNMRSGTLATHQILGMAKAYQLASLQIENEYKRITKLNQLFFKEISSVKYTLHGNRKHSVPHIINLRFGDISAQDLLKEIPNIAISTGSACNGKSKAPSHVLRAMGIDKKSASGAIRISFGLLTTTEDIIESTKLLKIAIKNLASPS